MRCRRGHSRARAAAPFTVPAGAIRVSGPTTLERSVALDGLFPEHVMPDQSLRLVAELPDGQMPPLVWLHGYDERMPHPFLFRDVLRLPQGTVIHGIPPDISLSLLPPAK